MGAELRAEDLTVVIPSRQRQDILDRTLDGLAGQSVTGFETIVVLDGDDQPVVERSGVRTLVQPQAGPGAARNRGARASERALVLFLGDDMVPTPELVAGHLERHRTHPAPEVAVLGHVDWHPEASGGRILRWMDWSGTQFDYGSIDGEEAGFGRFYSCNVSLKRSFFLDAGGFDEAFAFYYEDLDCGWRLGERGMRLLYAPEARVQHLHSYDLARVERRFAGIAEGERQMAAKHPWFEPYYRQRVRRAMNAPPASRWWPVVADVVPASLGPLRRPLERRADRWYHQQVGPAFRAAWDGANDLEELRRYLGDRFDEQKLWRHAELVEREEEEAPDEATFYRTSEMYLYDLTVFAMSGTKLPYLTDLRRHVGRGARLLDWGCGIGSDGLRLAEDGYHVSFVDFDNPSTAYLRWRMQQRGLDLPVYRLDVDDVPGGFDVAYSFDVIEHVDDPFAFLDELEQRAGLVMVNFLEPDPDDTHLHKPLPIDDLLDRCAARGLIHYRRYHQRSHLVLYRADGRRLLRDRARSVVERQLGSRLAGSPTVSH